MKLQRWLFAGVLFCSCHSKGHSLSGQEFEHLMKTLAHSWSAQDTEAAVACFTSDATYMQPPAEQLYQGHAQLRPYFGALNPGTTMVFHHLWFDEATQTGAGEFTFGNTQTKTGVTGVAIIQLHEGKIKSWREYFIEGPLDFDAFVSSEGKSWKWHIGNYP